MNIRLSHGGKHVNLVALRADRLRKYARSLVENHGGGLRARIELFISLIHRVKVLCRRMIILRETT